MGKYLKLLKNEEVEAFLEANNYMLITHLKDSNNETLPAIDRSPNTIFIRCKQKIEPEQQLFETAVAYYLMKKHPGFLSMSRMASGQYAGDIEPLFMKDFYLSKICITEEDYIESDRLNEAYVKWMYNKFKNNGYLQDYKAFFDELEKSTQQKPEDENEME